MCDEYLMVRPYLSKDIYPLTKPGAASDIWCAVQYHDPDTDSGVIMAFRREDSAYSEASFPLYALSCESEYSFTEANGDSFVICGGKLTKDGFAVSIEKRRDSKLYFYKKK